jgi:hypothetical protein
MPEFCLPSTKPSFLIKSSEVYELVWICHLAPSISKMRRLLSFSSGNVKSMLLTKFIEKYISKFMTSAIYIMKIDLMMNLMICISYHKYMEELYLGQFYNVIPLGTEEVHGEMPHL